MNPEYEDIDELEETDEDTSDVQKSIEMEAELARVKEELEQLKAQTPTPSATPFMNTGNLNSLSELDELNDMIEDIQNDLPDLPKEELREIRKWIINQCNDGKTTPSILKQNNVHKIWADRVYMEAARKGKIKTRTGTLYDTIEEGSGKKHGVQEDLYVEGVNMESYRQEFEKLNKEAQKRGEVLFKTGKTESGAR